jgi:hypothetical protein
MLSVIFEMLFYVLVEILFNGIIKGIKKSSKWFKNKNSPRISLEKKEKQ